MKELSDRSYLVKTGNQVLRRNREFLRPAQPKAAPKCTEVQVPKECTSQSERVQSRESVPETRESTVRRTRTRVVQTPTKFKDFVI